MTEYRNPEELRKESGIDAPLELKGKTEKLKLASHGLRGEVEEQLNDPNMPAVSEDSYNLMKHFGMYQQDDRDTRNERRRAGLDKDYSFMLRTKVPGGRLTADQYLVLDDIATKYTNGSLRLTTRQTIQFHGVGKEKLRALTRDLNSRFLTTYGACGDVVRNVMTCPVIDLDPRPEWRGRDVFVELSRQISDRTLPRTTAFYDIFIDGEPDNTGVPQFELRSQAEDIYGTSYMPRKFKIGIAIPEDNCIDVFIHDLGLVAIMDGPEVKGYNIMVGGGLGYQHSRKDTYPRLSTPVAYTDRQHIMQVVDSVITIQRDYGNRLDRKQARLKYLLDAVGPEWFHAEMERRVGVPLGAPVEINNWEYHDHLGWHEQKQPGFYYCGINIDSGRIIDRPGQPMRTVLRRIVEKFRPSVRLTGQQNILLANVAEKHRAEIDAMLAEAKLATEQNGLLSSLRRHQISCVALPTCGLALAEAERAIPTLITKLEELGHGNERIQIRMSGCPNSCSRAPASEIGIIGVGPGKYNLYVGGDYEGTRINQLLNEKVVFEELPIQIGRLIDRWKAERNGEEVFGDWSHRMGVEALKS